ncbi:MAG: class F sortase [bacterium]
MALVVVVSCVLVGFFLLQLFPIHLLSGFSSSSISENQPELNLAVIPETEPEVDSPVVIGLPVRLQIPSIAVNAAIEKVALTADGAMDVPKDPMSAGWYVFGPRPGESGSAVIAGHLNWWHGAKGVFERLGAVKPGDLVIVEDDTGANSSFIVRESRKLDAKADTSEIFNPKDGKTHLNIVTCDGIWDNRARQYTKRLVVFTDKVEE